MANSPGGLTPGHTHSAVQCFILLLFLLLVFLPFCLRKRSVGASRNVNNAPKDPPSAKCTDDLHSDRERAAGVVPPLLFLLFLRGPTSYITFPSPPMLPSVSPSDGSCLVRIIVRLNVVVVRRFVGG